MSNCNLSTQEIQIVGNIHIYKALVAFNNKTHFIQRLSNFPNAKCKHVTGCPRAYTAEPPSQSKYTSMLQVVADVCVLLLNMRSERSLVIIVGGGGSNDSSLSGTHWWLQSMRAMWASVNNGKHTMIAYLSCMVWVWDMGACAFRPISLHKISPGCHRDRACAHSHPEPIHTSFAVVCSMP